MKKTLSIILAFFLIVAMLPVSAFAATSTADAPTITAVKRTAYNSLQIKWNKVSDADGYAVYKSTSKTGTYSLVKRIDSKTTTSYTWTKANVGTTYYFKVKAYKNVNGKRVYGKYSSAVSGKTYLTKPMTYDSSYSLQDYICAYFSKISGATGYEIWRSTDPDTGYKKVSTVAVKNLGQTYVTRTDNKVYVKAYKATNFKTNTVYYHKVRAYRLVNGKKVYSSFSDYSISYRGKMSDKPWTNITYLEGEGQKVLDYVNAERKKTGLPELAWDEELEKYAKVRVQNVARVYYRDGYLSHRPIDPEGGTGLMELGLIGGVAENVAIGYLTAKDVFTAWMNSPGHKALFFDYYDPDYLHISAAIAGGIDANGNAFYVYITRDGEWYEKSFEYFE